MEQLILDTKSKFSDTKIHILYAFERLDDSNYNVKVLICNDVIKLLFAKRDVHSILNGHPYRSYGHFNEQRSESKPRVIQRQEQFKLNRVGPLMV